MRCRREESVGPKLTKTMGGTGVLIEESPGGRQWEKNLPYIYTNGVSGRQEGTQE